MNHILDVIAHAALRSIIWRAVYHTPYLGLAFVALVVILYLARRYP